MMSASKEAPMTTVHANAQTYRMETTTSEGAAAGGVRILLRLEGLVVLIAAVLAYRELHADWIVFAVLFLTPDLSMLGYLVNTTVGAASYNAGHTYLAPGLLGMAAFAAGVPALYGVALIWAAHIGFDRMLGYGLKYASGFGVTHLGLRGRRP
jgi:hypothetical protein